MIMNILIRITINSNYKQKGQLEGCPFANITKLKTFFYSL